VTLAKLRPIHGRMPGLEKKDVNLLERSVGSFARSVELPAEVEPVDITVEIAKGVLKVTVQKPAPKQSKQIDFKTAA
jgi:HSP20 family protein